MSSVIRKGTQRILDDFIRSLNDNDFDIPHKQEVQEVLIILSDLTQHKYGTAIANAFKFGLYMAKRGEQVADEFDNESQYEKDMEQAKKCIQCDYIIWNGASLKCRLQRCKYEK